MNETETTTAVVDGPGEGTPAQESGSASQDANQTQETTNTNTERVEGTEQDASSAEKPRPAPRASDYFQKREFGRLKDTIAEQNRRIEELVNLYKQPPSQAKPNIPDWLSNPQVFWEKPQENLFRLMEEAKASAKKEAMEEFQRTLPGALKEYSTGQERERNMQDALELIFPNKGNEKNPLEKRIASDPDRAERLMEILNETGLNELSQTKPKEAAQLAMLVYEKERAQLAPSKPAPNPTILKKSLVGPTATGNKLSGGEKAMPTLQELRAERDRIEKQMDENPALRIDPAFMQKRDELKRQYSASFKELRGDQK